MEVSTTFIYYCAGTTMIAAFVASQLLHLSLLTPQPYRIGLIFGVVGGVLGAYFNHTATFSLTATNPQALDIQITTLLAETGYSLAQQEPNPEDAAKPEDSSKEKMAGRNKPSTVGPPPTLEIYRPSFWRSLFTGPIIIQRNPHQLTFISRAQTIKWLREQLS
ncbi:hypothetical protein RIF25_02460 [Thermosynechococcaceae cyanobacterium BACA0444]|uniref:Uncharacterized protein n=1 Tax=Pseudocalidococcus azoricus BACA0444 TaxID=2918990 RepID=A0AAE4JYG0_9CYAN|nr:hypothetical protein [Pseudocalidococcus azoricus]MDS3859662.1 hypothetical protein [Pseudocalidococcus azoricus BACA0444]